MTVLTRLLIGLAAMVGACAIAVPAVLGLSGNSAFSQHIRVRVPSTAHSVSFDAEGRAHERAASQRLGFRAGSAREPGQACGGCQSSQRGTTQCRAGAG